MEALGIEPKLLLAQIVNFVIVLFLLRKFLYTPIINMLETRQEKISTGIKNAEEAEEKLKSADTQSCKIIDEAEKEAKRIREEAKVEAKKEHDRILLEANKKADKLIDASKEEAQNLKTNALTSAKKELSEVVSLAMEKVLGNDLDIKQKELITEKAINEL